MLLCGCLAVRTPEPGEPVSVAAGEGIVFGRVRAFELDREITPWDRELVEVLAEDPDIELALFHVESGRKRPDVPIAAQGRFAWILPAGTYLVYHALSVEPPCLEPIAAFQVAPTPEPADLGELVLAISVDRSLSASLATYTLRNVGSRAGSEETRDVFMRSHPGSRAVRPGVLVVDPELGGLFTDWSQEACARVLARHGMRVGRFDGP
jgi:hypothetical protein